MPGCMDIAARRRTPFSLSVEDVDQLRAGDAIVRDGVLGRRAALGVAAAAAAAGLGGGLQPARMGRAAALWQDVAERGDEMAWLEPGGGERRLARVWAMFEELRVAANRAAFLGLRRFDVQVACYRQPGARYARHADAFRAQFPVNRRLTAIYYPNPDWQPEHGGELVVYAAAGERRVAPVLDRLVVFVADEVEHEVLPSWRERWAITAWFYAAA